MTDRPGDDPAAEAAGGSIELSLGRSGYRLIAGVDEAGRGPLAGPVTAAAVILPPDFNHPGIRDSKACTPLERERLYEIIIGAALCWSVGQASAGEIDRVNIRQATFIAMRRALSGLSVGPDFVLVDGWEIPGISTRQLSLFHGESRSRSIAAASILAKVSRDRLMLDYDRRWPGYGFGRHKGYGTREHMDAIRELGPLPIHRKSFARVREFVPAEEPGR